MEKPRLARQTSVRSLVLCVALLCTAALTPAAEAAEHRPKPRHHHTVLPTPRLLKAAGFDTCWAPPVATMAAWYANTAYRAVGIYIGGTNRACVGRNLTPGWVQAVAGQGWSMIPVYVGLQAPCAKVSPKDKTMKRMKASRAVAEGAAAADDAAGQAWAYGLAPGSPVYFDLEAFDQKNTGCDATVLAFIDSWTRRLHSHGYYSAVYGSAQSGITVVADALQNKKGFAAPDDIWIARWDRQPRTTDDSVPAQLWSGRRRIKQYRGGHVEKHGVFSIDIDSDWLDGPVAKLR